MPATEEIPFFSREKCLRLSRRPISAVSEGGNHHLPRNFKEQKFKSHWRRAAFPCSFQETWRWVKQLGLRTLCIKKAGRDFKSVIIDHCTCFPNSNNTKSKQQEAALNPKRGNSYEYKKRVSQTITLRKLSLLKKNGGYLLSHGCAVPSARAGLTALFGMGRGGTPPL